MPPIVDGLKEPTLPTRARRSIDVLLVFFGLGVAVLFYHYAIWSESVEVTMGGGYLPFTLATVGGYAPILALLGGCAFAAWMRVRKDERSELSGGIAATLAACGVCAWSVAFDVTGTVYDESIFHNTLNLFALGCALLAMIGAAATAVVFATYRRQRRRDRGVPASLSAYTLSTGRRRIASVLAAALGLLLVVAGIANFLPGHHVEDHGAFKPVLHSLAHDAGSVLLIAVAATFALIVAFASRRRYLADVTVGVTAIVGALTLLALWLAFAAIGPHLFERVESLIGEASYLVSVLLLFIVGIVHTVFVQVLYRRSRRESLPSLPTAVASRV